MVSPRYRDTANFAHWTRQIPGLSGLTYEERLRKLGLPTLAYRRLRGDLIEVYKIANNIYDPDITRNIILFDDNRTLRGHNKTIKWTRTRLQLRKNYFSIRITPIWNSLPENVVNSTSIIEFEKKIDRHLTNQPLKYDHHAQVVCQRY